MRFLQLMMALHLAVLSASTANAEIYKWKDKGGYTRYSDTPPDANIKIEILGGKKNTKPTSQTPLPDVENKTQTPAVVADNPPTQGEAPPTQSPEDAAAQKRSKDAQAEKIAKQEKETQAKQKAENCKFAKSNLETYVQGGRISKMNENGEREFLGDADLKKGVDKSRGEVSKYCN